MTGQRIRQARLAAGLTLEEVAELLASRGRKITKAGLSKYEHDKSTPSPAFLMGLAQVLGVKASYFVREPSVKIEWFSFRMHASLTKSRQEQIKATAGRVAEDWVWLSSLFHPQWKPRFPGPKPVSSPEEAEEAAGALRKAWQLGDAPIESVTQCLEDHGAIVVDVTAKGVAFDGLCGRANRAFPVIVVSTSVPDDRRRYDLSHELGHLLMACDNLASREQEKLAHRFSAAFLVPARVARTELGNQRRSLRWDELGLLKRKYGLSMQAWARRAADLGIIGQSYYRALCMQFNARGWKQREPVDFACQEEPLRLRQMTLRALAEGMITADRAEEICPGGTAGLTAAAEPRRPAPGSARELLSLPRQARTQILSAAAADAEKVYRENRELTEFEAFGEKDLYG